MVTNQPLIDAWLNKDVTIRNCILASMEPDQKQNLYGIPTTREMWLKVTSHYASRAEEIENQYIQEIFTFKYDPSKNDNRILSPSD